MGPGKPGSSKRARGGPLAIARSFGPPGLAPGIPGTPLPALIYIYIWSWAPCLLIHQGITIHEAILMLKLIRALV